MEQYKYIYLIENTELNVYGIILYHMLRCCIYSVCIFVLYAMLLYRTCTYICFFFVYMLRNMLRDVKNLIPFNKVIFHTEYSPEAITQ